MPCRCYEIGGPFIAEDPYCEIHRDGGYMDMAERYREALVKIKEIPHSTEGGDWDEIEEAQRIAAEALEGKS